MRRISEIKDLPISQLTDEEICKAAMHRLNSNCCALIYRSDDGHFSMLWRFRDKKGRAYWNKIQATVMQLWNRVYTKFALKYGFEHVEIYKNED